MNIRATFFKPIPGNFLGVLRISTSLIAIVLTVILYFDATNLYASQSYFNHEILFLLDPVYYPKLSWLTDFLQTYLGLGEITAIKSCLTIYVMLLTLLLLGIFTRVVAGLCMFFAAVFTASAAPMVYGADFFILSGLFYCFILPSSSAYTIGHLLTKKAPTQVPVLFLYTLQAHLAMIYLFNGIAKSFGESWWSGEAIWRATMLLDTRAFDLGFMAAFPLIFVVLTRIVLVFELLYPVLIFFRFSRLITVVVIILMHLFIGIFMKLYFFAAIMIAFNIAAFWPMFSRLSLKNVIKRIRSVTLSAPINISREASF